MNYTNILEELENATSLVPILRMGMQTKLSQQRYAFPLRQWEREKVM